MAHRFRQHYTREQARALLPKVKGWLDDLVELRGRIARAEMGLAESMASGLDLGGPSVNQPLLDRVKLARVVREFQSREIQIKDLDRGLIDFPALIEGREVFLCWEKSDDDIDFYHDIDAGYSGREPLD